MFSKSSLKHYLQLKKINLASLNKEDYNKRFHGTQQLAPTLMIKIPIGISQKDQYIILFLIVKFKCIYTPQLKK